MEKECDKSENGEHEPDFETLAYKQHFGLRSAQFFVTCLHCKIDGEITIDAGEVDWAEAE